MYDANLIMQSLTTVAATLNSTAVDLKVGTPRRGLKARFLVNTATVVATGTVFTPSIQDSDDNTTFTTLAAGTPITGATAGTSAVIFVPFETSRRYARSVMTLSVTTGTPSIAFSVDIGEARP